MTLHPHLEASTIAALMADDDLFSLERVTTACVAQDGYVHLADQLLTAAEERTLCQVPVTRPCAASRLWSRPCADCITIALRAGFTFAREGSAHVNLQRMPSPGA